MKIHYCLILIIFFMGASIFSLNAMEKEQQKIFSEQPNSLVNLATKIVFDNIKSNQYITLDNISSSARKLLREKAKSEQESPLYSAITSKGVENFMKLGLGADINSCNDEGETAFNALIHRGNIQGAAYLLKNFDNLDISLPNILGVTPLQRAIKQKALRLAYKIIMALIEKGKVDSINTKNNIPHKFLSYVGVEETIILAAKYTPELISSFFCQGMDCSKSTIKEVIGLLLSESNFNHALWVAIILRDINKAHEIMDRGINPSFCDFKEYSLLMLAVKYLPALVERLIWLGADVNARDMKGWTALMFAAESNFSVIPALLEAGADVNAQNNNGFTALMLGVRWKLSAVTKLLRAKGIDVNSESKTGWTALMIAAHFSPAIIANLRQVKKINTNAQDKNGWTALMFAAQHNPLSVLKLLKATGLDVNVKNINGFTALMLAVRWNSSALSELLKVNGLEINAKNNYGQNALKIAKKYNPGAIPALIEAGAINE